MLSWSVKEEEEEGEEKRQRKQQESVFDTVYTIFTWR